MSLHSYEANFTFRDSNYRLHLSTPLSGETNTPFVLTLNSLDSDPSPHDPDASSDSVWSSSFTPSEVEQMTSKTGEFHTFAEMVGMMSAILRAKQNGGAERNQITYVHKNPLFNTVGIDVLTYADLELLKQRRAGGNPAAATTTPRTSANRRKLNKRYVIMTIGSKRNEDEKIHYPLPLPCIQTHHSRSLSQNGSMQASLQTDVSALKAQIARLTQNMTQTKPKTSPLSLTASSHDLLASYQPPSTSRSKGSSNHLYHSASAVEIRSYRDHDRDRVSDDDVSPRHSHSRSRTPSPSRSHRFSTRRHRDGEDRADSNRARRSHDVTRHDELASIAHLSRPTRHSSIKKRQHHIKNSDSDPESDDARHIEEPPELPPTAAKHYHRLETQVMALKEELKFEKQVSTARITTLETENRSLRKKEKDLVDQLTKSQEALSLLTLESERLKAKVEEFMLTARSTNSRHAPDEPVDSRGRSRTHSRASSLTRTPAASSYAVPRSGSLSPSQNRMLARSNSSSNVRSTSPYLQAQRDRRAAAAAAANSGRSTPIRSHSQSNSRHGSRAPSPSGSGRNTPTQQHAMRSSSARSPARHINGNGLDSPTSTTRQPRTPIDQDYRHWPISNRSGSRSPLRRFNPSDYVAMKKEKLARKAVEMAERNRAEIARSTRPSPLTTTILRPASGSRSRGQSPAATMGARSSSPGGRSSLFVPSAPSTITSHHSHAHQQAFSNSYRGRRTPPPVFSFDQSDGHSDQPLRQPSVYVEGRNDRARSLRFPLDTKTGHQLHKSLTESLHRSRDENDLHAPQSSIDMSTIGDLYPSSHLPLPHRSPAGSAATRMSNSISLAQLDRDEFDELDELTRASRTPRTLAVAAAVAAASSSPSDSLSRDRFNFDSDHASSTTSIGRTPLLSPSDRALLSFGVDELPPVPPRPLESQLEPLIPTMTTEELEDSQDEEERRGTKEPENGQLHSYNARREMRRRLGWRKWLAAP